MSVWVAYRLDPALSPIRRDLLSPQAAARIEYARSAGRGRQAWLPASTGLVFLGAKATNASRSW